MKSATESGIMDTSHQTRQTRQPMKKIRKSSDILSQHSKSRSCLRIQNIRCHNRHFSSNIRAQISQTNRICSCRCSAIIMPEMNLKMKTNLELSKDTTLYSLKLPSLWIKKSLRTFNSKQITSKRLNHWQSK